MSATIYWEPVSPDRNYLHTPAPSWFMGCLERANMDLPHTFSEEDIPVLRGLAASIPSDNDNPFKELIKVIQDHGQVSVWATY